MRSLLARLFRTRQSAPKVRETRRQQKRKLLMESLEDRRVFNAAPTISWSAGTGIYRETAPAFILASGANLADTDSANFDTGALTVSITSGGATGDKLSVVNTGNAAGQIGVSGTTVSYGGTAIGTISGGLNGNALVVSLNASSSPAAAQQLLRNVAFSNTATQPTIGNRTIVATIDDGDGASATTTNVKTMYVNQLPVAAADAYSTSEDTTLSVSAPGLLSNDTDADGDTFTVSNVNGSTANVGAAIALTGGSLTVNANGSFTFVPTANWNGTQTFTYNVKDTLERPTTSTVTLTVNSVDDAVVFSATSDPNQTSNTVTFTEDGPAVVLLPAATLTDVDASSLTSLTITHTGAQGTSDRIDITNQGTSAGQIGWTLTSGSTSSGTYSGSLTYGGLSIGSFSAAGYSSALTVTLSGATLPAVQALIRAVTFNNTNTYNPSTNTRTLLFTLAGANQTVSCSVNIVAVNDAPQISLGGGVGYTERSAAVQIASAATVTDDVTTLVGRTITVSFSGTADSQATLAVKNVGTGAQQIGVSGSNITYSGTTMATFSGGTAGSPLVISVGGNASLAAIQAMVRQITYVSDNHNPAASYALSLAFNHGDGLTTTANKTINVTAIDEPLDPHDDVIELVAPASGSTYTVAAPGVLANDDPDTSYTLGLAIPAAQGTVTLTTGGGFTYTPNSGATGSDSFAYTIANDPTLHFVTVNMPPSAGSTSASNWVRIMPATVVEGNTTSVQVVVELLQPVPAGSVVNVNVSSFDFTGPNSATANADYGPFPSWVQFNPGGPTTQSAYFMVVNDTVEEVNWERFGVHVTASLATGGTSQALGTTDGTAWIEDDDANVSIVRVSDTTEGGAPGKFIVSRLYPDTHDLTVYLTNNTGSATFGTDYTTLNPVVITAGNTTVEVPITAKNDNLVEGDETVTFGPLSNVDYHIVTPDYATLTIHDNPATLSLSVPSQHASEVGPTQISVTLTRSGGDTTQQLPVTVNITGTANNGTDYNSLPSSVTFLENETSKTLTVTPKPDNLVEGAETVVFGIADTTTYKVGQSSAMVTIDDHPAVVSVVATTQQTAEGSSTPGVFTFTRTGGDLASSLTVNFSLDGSTATNGYDYHYVSTSLTFLEGESVATLQIEPVDDMDKEQLEQAQLTLLGPLNAVSGQYSLGSSSSATVSIADNEAQGDTNDDEYLVFPDSALQLTASDGVLANDFVGQNAVVELVDGTVTGALTLNPDGSLVYVPAGAERVEHFTYRVLSDGQVSRLTTVALVIALPQIWKGSGASAQNVTGATTGNDWVGEKIALDVRLPGAAAPKATYLWTIGGQAKVGVHVSLLGASSLPLEAPATENKSLAFHWLKPGSYGAAVTVTIPGSLPRTVNTTIIVTAPSVTFEAETSGFSTFVRTAYVGIVAANESDRRDGIVFSYSTHDDGEAASLGRFDMTQVATGYSFRAVESDGDKVKAVMTPNPEGVPYLDKKISLTRDPADDTKGVDSPSWTLRGDWRSGREEASFKTFLTWKSNKADSVTAAIKEISWTFNYDVSSTDGDMWVIDGSLMLVSGATDPNGPLSWFTLLQPPTFVPDTE